MSALTQYEQTPHTLRLFDQSQPDRPTTPPHRRRPLTLNRCWKAWFLPGMRTGNAPATIAEDMRNLRRFSRAWRSMNPRTITPGVPIRKITQSGMAEVAELLLDGFDEVPLAPNTVRKCLSTVRKVLREAEDRGKITRAPKMPKLPWSESEPVPLLLEEVDRAYRAADAALWPRIADIPPATTWRCWIVWFWIYGARTQDFVGYKTSKYDGLLWKSVSRETVCPIRKLRIEHEHGWLKFVPLKTRFTRRESLVLPLHPVALAHLNPFTGLDDLRVWPNGRSKQSFYRAWKDICAKAQLPPGSCISGSDRDDDGNPSLRKGCSNNWDEVRDGLGERVLGHVAQGTNGRHYKQVLPRLITGLNQLPLPPSFLD
ncbi:MAG: hypothetical protein KDA52_14180 [Planctomycetaceae bacterium]|nr:hypothetical protein [Planctomycetaceae bacterium]